MDLVPIQNNMNENTEKRIVDFTSQALRLYGIRAVRMDDIAKSMGMSKRTIYQTYVAKDNLVNTCLESYLNRMKNLFRIIKSNHPEILEYLWEVSKAYIENLYRAKSIFWLDVSQYLEYKYIYYSYNGIWSDELEQIISACQKEKYAIPDVYVSAFVESFTILLYNSRIAECPATMLYHSAYFMLRGIMTKDGIERFEYTNKLEDNLLKPLA